MPLQTSEFVIWAIANADSLSVMAFAMLVNIFLFYCNQDQ